ncbi:hypothetical protein MPDQ_002711 [Monascus purpureus]|uniref:Uncharacterized protein n=1 Tax=Monascus purpureus TaxID=5098 RepID=A0A507QJW9_MONPU|nr:hypothetical protein MPDQ_002711 [Monascus purpureus]
MAADEFDSTAQMLVVQFIHAGIQLVGQLYEIHSLDDDDQPVMQWNVCELHTQFTNLSSCLTGGCPREIGPLSQQAQALDDLRAASHGILRTLSTRLELIQSFGPGSLLHVGDLKQLWPLEDAMGLEERIIWLKSELEVAISSVQSLVTAREALRSLDITRDRRAPNEPTLLDQRRERSERPAEPGIVKLFGEDPTEVQNKMAYEEVEKVYTKDTLFTDHEMIIQDFLLESLKFPSMTDRENSVTTAHSTTFDWIFAPSSKPSAPFQGWRSENSLANWLRNGEHQERIYWISGKAGSGKSTLMQFVMQHAETVNLLRSWAGNKQLITAGFYFWISGTLEQRSQTGLMRYLLYQLLSEQKHLIPVVFPARWKHLRSLSTRERVKASISWDLLELTGAMESFMHYTGNSGRICLFIDGLDEFAGDHQQIVAFLKNCVTSFPHVKICLSSRPLPAFWETLGNNPRLELHQLTQRDMLHFAEDRLYGNPSINQLFSKDKDAASQLILDIVERADGVFLWVMLVVQSLLRREKYEDVLQMHEYLREHPTNIDNLFAYFIFDTVSKDQTFIISRLFQIIQAREEACYVTQWQSAASMSLWEFALADQLEESMPCIPTDVQQASELDITRICEVTRALLSGECAGLIITHSSFSSPRMLQRDTPSHGKQLAHSKVSYVHRTVKDFLSLPHVRSRLLEPMLGSTFEPHSSLLTSIILQFKRPLDEFQPHRQIDDWWPSILLAFTHARLSMNCWQSQLVLIPELDRALCQHWAFRRSIKFDHWARSLFSSYEKRKNLVFRDPFLSLSAKFGLAVLVRERILEDNSRPHGSDVGDEIPLLSHCIELLASRRQTVYPLSSPEIINDVLASGADPNQPYKDLNGKNQTPWLVVLDYLREADRRQWIRYYDTSEDGTFRLAAIVSLFIQYGADPNALLLQTRFDPSASALEIITAIYRKYAVPEFGRLRKVLIERGAYEREGHDIFYQVYGR